MPREKRFKLSRVFKSNLYEEEDLDDLEDNEEDIEDESDDDTEDTKKDKDVKNKEIKDIDKSDLEDEENVKDEDVAVSLKLNDNVEQGGQIKLVSFKRLSTLVNIEGLLSYFDINPENVSSIFKDAMLITIQSPLNDFKNEQYIIKLMDGIGEIIIHRQDFNNTITKMGTGATIPMDQAVQQQTGDEETAEVAKPIDLSYLPALNFEFKRSVKNEFFDRILARQ